MGSPDRSERKRHKEPRIQPEADNSLIFNDERDTSDCWVQSNDSENDVLTRYVTFVP